MVLCNCILCNIISSKSTDREAAFIFAINVNILYSFGSCATRKYLRTIGAYERAVYQLLLWWPFDFFQQYNAAVISSELSDSNVAEFG